MKKKNELNFPSLPGVYLFYDKDNKVIYVGKAKSLKNRLASYFRGKQDSLKTRALLDNYSKIDYIVVSSELEALLLENKLIKKFNPKYNIQWKDDKSYPYIKITMDEEWPRIFLTRKKENDHSLYFGPYESKSVTETIKLLTKLFPIRTCKSSPLKIRKQPCLKYHIKRCWAPCINAISNEQYRAFVKAAVDILSGDLNTAISSLAKEMEELSREQKFEQAAKIRNKIYGLQRISESRKKPSWQPKQKVRTLDDALVKIKEALKLESIPFRIEAFDVSNTSGQETVASMVVFEGGEPLKSDYRKFIIRSVAGPNDFESIGEVVLRRYTKTLKDKLEKPDLILVDGGAPQVASAKRALKKAGLNIPMVGLAKREEILYFPDKTAPLSLPSDSSARLLLQRIRDEAHRFAITFHKKRRANRFRPAL